MTMATMIVAMMIINYWSRRLCEYWQQQRRSCGFWFDDDGDGNVANDDDDDGDDDDDDDDNTGNVEYTAWQQCVNDDSDNNADDRTYKMRPRRRLQCPWWSWRIWDAQWYTDDNDNAHADNDACVCKPW